jgi:hypothetical protein
MRSRRTIASAMAIALAAIFSADAQSAPRLARRPAPATPAERPRIVNGVFTGEYPTVGALLRPGDPEDGSTWCSGTMIGCETFLTAAHCVCDSVGSDCQPGGIGEPDPSDFGVFLQHAGFFTVASIAVHPSYDFPGADVAVLKLEDPVTAIRPTAINTVQSPPDGSSATIVGFGRSGGANFDYGLKRAGDVETEVIGCDADQVCWQFESPLGPPGEDANTCNADSGGPLFWDAGSGDVVAGITSGGLSAGCNPEDYSYDANVFFYRSYIETEAGADLGPASCGSGPQVGDPEVTVTPFEGDLSGANPSDGWTVPVEAGTSSLRIALNASEQGSADFDLYVKHGTAPTTIDFDCKADGPNQYGYCEIADPAVGTWHVLVNRSSGSGDYQVTVTEIAAGCHPGNDGAPCDDGNPCTDDDECAASVCVGSAVANGTPCDDGAGCTSVDTCQAGACAGSETPHAGCLAPVAGRAATLVARDQVGEDRDLLTWTWKRGAATSKEDFGDPTAGATFDFCIYDETAGVSSVAYALAVPASAAWDESSSGYDYDDPDGAVGGLRRIVFRASPVDGRARLRVNLRGSALALPGLPLDQDDQVTVQLVGENACWGATYSSSASNASDRFRARSD